MSSLQSLLGRILRAPLAFIPRDAVVRILSGPLRGKKWIAGAASHGYWVGTYETALLKTFADAISPGTVIYDVGANVGIYALLACIRTGPAGSVYSFEPAERNFAYMQRHIALNRVENCTLVQAAVSDSDGTQRFAAAAWEHSMGHLSADGEIEVRSVTLDSCIYGEAGFRPPDVIKIDVEGAEREVLRGASRAIAEFHPTVFVEVHGHQHHVDCKAFLIANGYHVEESYGHLAATRPPS
jgi:FkbM family methyltransferase